jgi:hypothetical protein
VQRLLEENGGSALEEIQRLRYCSTLLNFLSKLIAGSETVLDVSFGFRSAGALTAISVCLTCGQRLNLLQIHK